MELLSVEYGDFGDLFDGGQPKGTQGACLKARLRIDPTLLDECEISSSILEDVESVFPGVRSLVPFGSDPNCELENIARLTVGIIVALQRDLCEWPTGRYCEFRGRDSEYEYDLYVESIDERVGYFAAQLAVETVRLLLRRESFDPRLIWVIDLVRHLRRQPRLRLVPNRVASLLGCSKGSAQWAIQELERYGYVFPVRTRRSWRSKDGLILVVDDSARIRDLLSRIVETLGYDAITAVDGEEGLILLDWARYRAIFVDLMMPSIDGVTFLRHARARGVACPIFVVSAYEHRWGMNEIKDLGATEYVTKPFSIAEIEEVLNRHLK